MELIIEKTNEWLNFNRIGKKIKKDKEGIIINNVALDKSIIFWIFLVSQYNQMNARKVVNGIDTIKPAKSEERFAISATTTTTRAVIKIFIIKYSITKLIFPNLFVH